MTPEDKFELVRLLLERGAEVRTFYRRRRVAAVEKADGQVVVRYGDGGVDEMHLRDFARRRFVAVV
jgi:uncharacterized protein YbjT (DUF2867 family)